MNSYFASFISTAMAVAAEHKLKWPTACDEEGRLYYHDRWNLTAAVGMSPPPTIWLSHIGYDRRGLNILNDLRRQQNLAAVPVHPLPSHWRDLYVATVVNEVFIKGRKPHGALGNVARWIKLLAAAAYPADPWQIDGEQVRMGYNAALLLSQSGKLASNYQMAVRLVIDGHHLADRPGLARSCLPLTTVEAQAAQAQVDAERKRVNGHVRVEKLRQELSERKGSQRLPEDKAFWELVRIVFTVEPATFSDAIRFEILKIALVTGLRAGELASLPADCLRWREYHDADGQPADRKCGIGRSLMLRHFAEKQPEGRRQSEMVLYEAAQHIPPMFEDVVVEAVERVRLITEPMRKRLRAQTASNRLLPEYRPHDLVPAHEAYVRISGSAMFSNLELPPDLLGRYRASYDPAVVEEIWRYQMDRINDLRFIPAVQYWSKYRSKGIIALRDRDGIPIHGNATWPDVYLRAGELEHLIHKHMPTKVPDGTPQRLASGQLLQAHDHLFLMPVRGLVEGRNGGIVDTTRYFAAGRISVEDIIDAVSAAQGISVFQRYGETPEDRALGLDPHHLRHVQNTELFRLGVSDAIITKRFNRRSVKQSHEYDHRSLLEDLDSIALPDVPTDALGPSARQTLGMILAGKVEGPIVEEFRQIQSREGDEAAFSYLEAEADGLHVTPYGFCLNSFTVDPCPKHLECFNGCRHLTRTEIDAERRALETLRERMQRTVDQILATAEPHRSIGWQNQFTHARTRLENIERTLMTTPGERPFPSGADLSRPLPQRSPATILNATGLPRGSDD
ncbi:conserved exported hypothetical protein [Mesorhizobium metallidurans STM 2683]|uniref:Integrase n=1 Tax=Mesorhizobium metallidurans STM 2683 TaxID=1297569 RepID=M5EZQ3_9HYPH|nr:hypothetical protein [Mesorhizobium metallidurans]CCV09558.1 conserved exported hypothetical protein [Mesorhizobium metallidurans STM 2683]